MVRLLVRFVTPSVQESYTTTNVINLLSHILLSFSPIPCFSLCYLYYLSLFVQNTNGDQLTNLGHKSEPAPKDHSDSTISSEKETGKSSVDKANGFHREKRAVRCREAPSRASNVCGVPEHFGDLYLKY